MNSIEALVVAHWGLIILSLYVLSDIVVAVTPKRYQEEKWYGLILKLFRWTSAHVHYDEIHTTLKVPLLNTPVRFGAKSADQASSKSAGQAPKDAS